MAFDGDAIRRWLTLSYPANCERLVAWCNQSSWSLDAGGLRAMATRLQDDFATIGIELEAIELPPIRVLDDDGGYVSQATGPALLWHGRPAARRRVLMMIHYDTVYPETSSPRTCERHGERLVGPGSADAKGGIATIFAAVSAIERFEIAPDVGVSILLNPDEEIGSPASKTLYKTLVPQFTTALLFEPTLPGGSLVRARKGSGNFAFRIAGRSAHAGRNPQDGRNAIVRAAELVTKLATINEPGTQINVGRIVGGGPLNQVPDRTLVQLNARVDTAPAAERVEARLRQLAAELSTDGFRIELAGEFHAPPKVPDPKFEALQKIVEQAGRAIDRPIEWRDTGGACDGSQLAAWGLPNVDSLGVIGEGLHSPEEYCQLDSLVPAAMLVVSIVDQLGRSVAGEL